MPGTWKVAIAFGGVIALVVAAQACLDPTQITLVLDADPQTCAAINNVAIVVRDDPFVAESTIARKEYAASAKAKCDANGHVGTLVLTPPGKKGSASLAVIAGIGATTAESCNAENGYLGCIVARRSLPFVEHTPLTLPIRLSFDCLNVPCDARSTCSNRKCVSSTPECEGEFCSKQNPTPVDAATSNDASSCTGSERPRACPPYGGGSVCNDTCCAIGGGYGYGYGYGSPFDDGFDCNASCPYFSVTCAGRENCKEGEVCCVSGVQTVCRQGSCGPQIQACVADCECPADSVCATGGTFPVTIKTCRKRP